MKIGKLFRRKPILLESKVPLQGEELKEEEQRLTKELGRKVIILKPWLRMKEW